MTINVTKHTRQVRSANHGASPLGPFAFRLIAFVVAWIVGLGAVAALSPRATADEMGSPLPAEEAAETGSLDAPIPTDTEVPAEAPETVQ